ncbi:TonB family C-terminal domain protein [Verrucomicrobiia bacterium DG1235]|nr:TonB family C-terminal domain protein [Verrucomicrobiae bacterium DG1235]
MACIAPFLSAEDSPPIPIGSSVVFPSLEGDLASESGKVEVMVAVSPKGMIASVEVISSTNERLDSACVSALGRWEFDPAKRSGKPAIGIYRQLFRFEEGEPLYDRKTMDLLASAVEEPSRKSRRAEESRTEKEEREFDSEASEKIAGSVDEDRNQKNAIGKRVAPVLSKVHDGLSGTVNVAFEVAKDGSVEKLWIRSSTQEALNLPTLDAARQWTFEEREGVDRTITIGVPFVYTAKILDFSFDDVLDSVSPSVESQPVAIYEAPVEVGPDESGFVETVFVVDELGYVSNPSLGLFSSPELAEKVSSALYSFRFKPALSRGKAIATSVKRRFEFDKVESIEDSLEKLPVLLTSVKPKLRRSLADLKGHVLMHLRIDARGNVIDARVMESSHPSLVKPTREAAEQCTFSPGYKDGRAVESTIVIPFFYPVQEGA